ncbi:MAG: hypothetical protein LBM39_02965 [Candidatus Methanoplasma sp.]|jgi:hypothetical protein|nr:hypothetical protein [Candidatus Methanoplasma sp.]
MSEFDEPETKDPIEETSTPETGGSAVGTEEPAVQESDGIETDAESDKKSGGHNKLTDNKVFAKADNTLDKVAGSIGAKSGSNKKLVAFAIIGVAVILVIAVIAVAFLGGGSGGPQAPYESDVYGDPVIQGDLGINTTFTYSAGGETVTVKIVGQSGSYYLLDVSSISGKIGLDAQYQMIHKTNGSLRFGLEKGSDTYTTGGSEKKLTVWTIIDGSDSSGKDIVWTFSVSSDDGIPYKIKAVSGADTVEADFSSVSKVSSGSYSKPSVVGTYYEYSLDGKIDGSTARGILDAGVAAEVSGSCVYAFVTDAKVSGKDYRSVDYGSGPSDLTQTVFVKFTAFTTVDGQFEITTIDGAKLCNRYVLSEKFPHVGEGGYASEVKIDVVNAYADPTTHVVYRYILNLNTLDAEGNISTTEDNFTLILKEKNL